MSVKVSICITTYNRVSYLKRLLDSIATQTFTDYEILITDNSETSVVKDFVTSYKGKLPIAYHKNIPAVGMTENWNICMAMAKGEWIKLIHDDDWLATETALAEFVDATIHGSRFIYAARFDYYESTGKYVKIDISQAKFKQINDNPILLMVDNYLGPPSVLMFHSSVKEYYDSGLKWYVDIEYYMTTLKREKAIYISTPLINMSYNDSQMTNSCLRNPEIMLPEFIYILNKHKIEKPTNILVYDAWWRLFRNLQIRRIEEIKKYCPKTYIPEYVHAIISHQRLLPKSMLKVGIISKMSMGISYLLNADKRNKY